MEKFSIKYISYKLILIISIVLFFSCYYLDTIIRPSVTTMIFVFGYMFAAMLAAFWAILNYIDHLRINPLYKSYRSIDEFINDLTVPNDEKNEIKTMMVDYVHDRKESGLNEDKAIEDIINQFKNEELDREKGVFFVHTHKYLLSMAAILYVVAVLSIFIPGRFFLVLRLTSFCYASGFLLSFFMYNILNKILIKK